MAANDEFPRGTVQSVDGVLPLSLTLPAAPGIAHVLDGIDLAFLNQSGVVGAVVAAAASTSLTVTLVRIGAPAGSGDAGSFAGPLSFAAGEAVTVSTAGAAGQAGELKVTWHDV